MWCDKSRGRPTVVAVRATIDRVSVDAGGRHSSTVVRRPTRRTIHRFFSRARAGCSARRPHGRAARMLDRRARAPGRPARSGARPALPAAALLQERAAARAMERRLRGLARLGAAAPAQHAARAVHRGARAPADARHAPRVARAVADGLVRVGVAIVESKFRSRARGVLSLHRLASHHGRRRRPRSRLRGVVIAASSSCHRFEHAKAPQTSEETLHHHSANGCSNRIVRPVCHVFLLRFCAAGAALVELACACEVWRRRALCLYFFPRERTDF